MPRLTSSRRISVSGRRRGANPSVECGMRALLVPVTAITLAACGRHIQLPPVPVSVPAMADSAGQQLARSLAPVLYVQRDEPFSLLRVVAVIHPTQPIVAYHLLWSHDVNGQWMPWTKPSDEEVVWVGYDRETDQPTHLWTYWHGDILSTDWRGKGQPAVDVQWGKHGSLPHCVIESDLPRMRTLNAFYLGEYLLLPDIWLSKLAHGGPWGFFHSYGRYRDFSRVMPLAPRLDAVLRTEDPRSGLHAVFGAIYSNKRWWPTDSVPQ